MWQGWQAQQVCGDKLPCSVAGCTAISAMLDSGHMLTRRPQQIDLNHRQLAKGCRGRWRLTSVRCPNKTKDPPYLCMRPLFSPADVPNSPSITTLCDEQGTNMLPLVPCQQAKVSSLATPQKSLPALLHHRLRGGLSAVCHVPHLSAWWRVVLLPHPPSPSPATASAVGPARQPAGAAQGQQQHTPHPGWWPQAARSPPGAPALPGNSDAAQAASGGLRAGCAGTGGQVTPRCSRVHAEAGAKTMRLVEGARTGGTHLPHGRKAATTGANTTRAAGMLPCNQWQPLRTHLLNLCHHAAAAAAGVSAHCSPCASRRGKTTPVAPCSRCAAGPC